MHKPVGTPLSMLTRLHPLLPKRFPTLSELAQTPADSPVSSRRSGLFYSLVGRPEVMLNDLLRDPEKYEERESVSAILQSLIAGRQKMEDLSPQDMETLDRATLDLNRSYSRKPSTSSPAPSPPKKQPISTEPPKDEESPPEELFPKADLVPHWFR